MLARRALAARGLVPVLSVAWPWVRLLPGGATKARTARPATHALLAAASTNGTGAAVAPAPDAAPRAVVAPAAAACAELTQMAGARVSAQPHVPWELSPQLGPD